MLLLAPLGLDLWFINAFAVNVPFADSWNGTLPFVKEYVTGNLQFAQLWAPHNENRMLFPNLILALVDSHDQVNSVVDMYLTAAVMAASLALLLWLVLRSSRIRLVWLLPVPFLFFSLAQVGNLLWAFQLAWMVILLCVVVALHGLESSPRHRSLFLLAAVAAVVASFSSLQGLLVWPAGLVYGAGRGLSRAQLALWCGIGVVSTAVYAWHLGNVGTVSSPNYAVAHPGLALEYFLRLLGDVVPGDHTVAGLLLLAASAGVGWFWYRRQVSLARLRLPLALWLSGILFDVLVTVGRLELNAPDSSRYTTYNLMLLIGLYLGAVAALDPPRRWPEVGQALRSRPAQAALTALVLALVVVQVAWSLPNGIHQGQLRRASREQGAQLLLHYQSVPDSTLAASLYPPSGAYVKVWAKWLQSEHWSVFS